MSIRIASFAAAIVLAAGPLRAQVFSDNFNDGDDAGWTHYEPLAPFGAGATYTFPSGGYRITAPPSPAPATLGPNRVAAFPDGIVAGDTFEMSVDILDWGTAAQTGIGLVARSREIGLGTSDAYYLHANLGGTDAPLLNLDLIINEAPSGPPLAGVGGFSVAAGADLRLVFSANGADLTGQLFDLADLSTPLATISANDATLTSGPVGVLTSGLIDVATGEIFNDPLDATFDNFSIVPEPASFTLLWVACLALTARRR